VGAGDQLPERRHGFGGQRPDVRPEPIPPLRLGPILRRDRLRVPGRPDRDRLRIVSYVGPIRRTGRPRSAGIGTRPAPAHDRVSVTLTWFLAMLSWRAGNASLRTWASVRTA